MWSVSVSNRDDKTADVVANFNDGVVNFSWSSTIKLSEYGEFVKTAKKALVKYTNLHKNEDTMKSMIEMELNK
jgi:hypothetical protein